MNRNQLQQLARIGTTIGWLLVAWFLLASFITAFHKTIGNDDAMFIAIAKNALQGYGWATGYGEKIPFNPDISTGPGLLLPGMLLLALFGNTFWIPAVTATLLHSILSLLLAWQLYRINQDKSLAALAFFAAIIISTGLSFIEYSAYCTTVLLFLFCLAFSLNEQQPVNSRAFLYGFGACLALYTKPLGLSLFLVCAPFVIANMAGGSWRFMLRSTAILLFGFFICFSPWQLYKNQQLNKYPQSYQQAHKAYGQKFFEEHGSGIAQLREAENSFEYLRRNTEKNHKILNDSLKQRYRLGTGAIFIILLAGTIFLLRQWQKKQLTTLHKLVLLINLSVLAQATWFTVFSFAMSAGHTYYIQVLWVTGMLLGFCCIEQKALQPVLFLLAVTYLIIADSQRIQQSLSTGYDEKVIAQQELQNIIPFLEQQQWQQPLASCGYTLMPKVVDYLLEKPGQIRDCNHLLEDALKETDQGWQWQHNVQFTGIFLYPLAGFLTRPEQQLYQPILQQCVKNTLYKDAVHIVCPIDIARIQTFHSPEKTAELLEASQQWYRTRIKPE